MEVENLGFHVYRSATPFGPRQRLTQQFIPARGTSMGGTYHFHISETAFDPPAWYWLEDIDWHFESTFHGPLRGAIPF